MPAAKEIDWSRLARSFGGEIVRAGDDGMAHAGKHFAAGRPLPSPQALLRCCSAEDIVVALDVLRANVAPFAVRSGGHCFADFSSSDSVILDLSLLNEIDVGDGVVRVGAGALAGDVSRALSQRGKVMPTGGCPLVAIGGLTLVGGFGFLGRRHGLACDQVERMRVVTVDGDARTIGPNEDGELFWAMCGAGAAGFAIATAITLRTQPLPPIVICNGRWPLADAVRLIDRWQSWVPLAPCDAGIELSLMQPLASDEPCFIELYGAVVGDRIETAVEDVRRMLGPLAAGLRAWSPSPAVGADYLVGLANRAGEKAWLPSRPYRDVGYQFTRSNFFERPLPEAAIAECVRQFAEGAYDREVRELEFIPWGGAYADDNPHACFNHRSAKFMIRHTVLNGARATEEIRQRAKAWVETSAAIVKPHANGRVYQGYADQALPNWEQAYYGDAYQRLQAIKRRYDPGEVLRHPQSIASFTPA